MDTKKKKWYLIEILKEVLTSNALITVLIDWHDPTWPWTQSVRELWNGLTKLGARIPSREQIWSHIRCRYLQVVKNNGSIVVVYGFFYDSSIFKGVFLIYAKCDLMIVILSCYAHVRQRKQMEVYCTFNES